MNRLNIFQNSGFLLFPLRSSESKVGINYVSNSETKKVSPESIAVHVKMIYSEEGSKGKYGVEFTIGDEKIPVTFSSSDQTMIYVATLLCTAAKQDLPKKMFRRAFLYAQNEKVWLHDLYNALRLPGDFKKWFRNVTIEGAHRINDAKSKVNKTITAVLAGKYDELISHLTIECVDAKTKESRYHLSIPADNITIDPKISDSVNINK